MLIKKNFEWKNRIVKQKKKINKNGKKIRKRSK